jgi:hypothetical protein
MIPVIIYSCSLSGPPFLLSPTLLLFHNAGGKQVILVVLHHTYDHGKFVSPKAKEISANILLSVDVMFYEGKMLECPHNEREFDKILKIVGYPYSTVF